MTTKTIYEELYNVETKDGLWLGVGTMKELQALCDDGILPPASELTFVLIQKGR